MKLIVKVFPEITIKGRPDPTTGFVVDLSKVSQLIEDHAVSKLDHRNIDLDVDFMKGRLSSTENLSIAIWEQLVEPIAALGCSLHCVKVQETENNSVEYHGEQ